MKFNFAAVFSTFLIASTLAVPLKVTIIFVNEFSRGVMPVKWPVGRNVHWENRYVTQYGLYLLWSHTLTYLIPFLLLKRIRISSKASDLTETSKRDASPRRKLVAEDKESISSEAFDLTEASKRDASPRRKLVAEDKEGISSEAFDSTEVTKRDASIEKTKHLKLSPSGKKLKTGY
ncbi:hypothetical protein F8M41_004780 [Gigaspora margarita]|uniref:Uncharacterized protein n=1 Tax=Gigaspora margarita TaxID=4874 RepID=A0A8H4AXJ3_GIGMA|nr:hypothetical protein F8M41_004780 [Gigaspora margarita]